MATLVDDDGVRWPAVCYGDAIYSRRCPRCGRYVSAHPTAIVNEVVGAGPAYGDCARCGEIELVFCGWAHEMGEDAAE